MGEEHTSDQELGKPAPSQHYIA